MGYKIFKTNKEFVDACNIRHNNKFLYLTEYTSKNKNKIITIKCKEGGHIFDICVYGHLKGYGCKQCYFNSRKLTDEEFILKLSSKKDNRYISLEKYTGAQNKIIFKCNICLDEFKTSPNTMLCENYLYCSCRENPKTKLTNDIFLKRLKDLHGDTFTPLEEYKGTRYKMKVLCNGCKNTLFITPDHLFVNEGCPQCEIISRRTTHEEFVKRSNEIHENRYECIGKYVDARSKIEFKCLKCDNLFNQTAASHLQGAGCPRCHDSRGERKIRKFLENNKISFTPQKTFLDCKGVRNKLPFDFYLDDFNICIEFDGEQHFIPVRFKGMSKEQSKESFKQTIKNDKIKNKYCENNNIKLFRISYKDFDKIDVILTDFLPFIV